MEALLIQPHAHTRLRRNEKHVVHGKCTRQHAQISCVSLVDRYFSNYELDSDALLKQILTLLSGQTKYLYRNPVNQRVTIKNICS